MHALRIRGRGRSEVLPGVWHRYDCHEDDDNPCAAAATTATTAAVLAAVSGCNGAGGRASADDQPNAAAID